MNRVRRILILTADAGFGHRSAANAIASALRTVYDDACLVEIANPLDNPRVPSSLRSTQADHDHWMQENPDLYQMGYQAISASLPSALAESMLGAVLYDAIQELLDQWHPDVVITTYPLYQSAFDAVRAFRRQKLPFITVVTDLALVHRLWFHSCVTKCLVPTIHVRDQALAAGLRSEQLEITGLPVHLDFSRDMGSAESIRRALDWRLDRRVVLAVGSRRVRGLAQVIGGLNHSSLPIQLILVTGKDDELYDQLNRVDWHLPVKIYNYVSNMPDMMYAADCLISKAGGLIVSEALASGLPILLIDANPGQEQGNADYVVREGAGRLAQDPLESMEILFHWLDNDGKELSEVASCARNLGRPKAALTVANLAWEMAEINALHKNNKVKQWNMRWNAETRK